MGRKKVLEREIVYSLEDIPEFVSEEEERAWWATHDLAEELGTDVTEEHHALIQQLKAKYRKSQSPNEQSLARRERL
jgi:hypothetical protein